METSMVQKKTEDVTCLQHDVIAMVDEVAKDKEERKMDINISMI